MMTTDEILERLRKRHVDGVFEWGDDYDGFLAELQGRLGCLSVKLTQLLSTTLIHGATGDAHYYSFELPLHAPPDRVEVSVEDVEAAGGEALYLVVYCSSALPLVEGRWHVFTVSDSAKLAHQDFDLLDQKWLSGRKQESNLALKVVEAVEACGWQLVGPEITEQPAPKDWAWPLPSWDYQNGDYLVRDYIIRGMRDY